MARRVGCVCGGHSGGDGGYGGRRCGYGLEGGVVFFRSLEGKVWVFRRNGWYLSRVVCGRFW